MKRKYKYEIWTIGYTFKKEEKPRLFAVSYTLQECGLRIGLTAGQARERMLWGFDPEFKSYHVINEFIYQIKRIPSGRDT